MYDELYRVWKQELESVEMEELPSNFYSDVAEYFRRIREESRMLDKKTVKAVLLRKETENVERMVLELIRTRYWKLTKKVARGEAVPSNVLTSEENEIYTGLSPLTKAYRSFTKRILRGHAPKVQVKLKHKRTVLRFLKDVPAIVGKDMKTYGPFKTEDIGSLPIENAEILVRRNLAEKVELE